MSEQRRSIVAYLVAVAATGLILTFVLELWRVDLRIPFDYGEDALCMQLWTKGMFEHGWYLHNGSVGAPFGLDMQDFPLSDSLILLAIKGFCLAASSPVVGLNLYYLSTYVLATLSALFVFRRFGVPRGPSVAGALLFAFLPYHLIRAERHLCLGSYYLVPPALMMVIRLLLDREGFGRRRTLAGVAIGLLLGSAGVYYAFFTCFLLAVAGTCGAWGRRSARPLGTATILIAAIVASVGGNVLPKVAYDRRHGPNPDAVLRSTDIIEPLSLKLTPMLLPIAGHRVPALARLREGYDAVEPEFGRYGNAAGTLGMIGALGFVTLMVAVFLRRRDEVPGLLEGLGRLNLACYLLAMTGGIGMMFGLLVTPWIRAYHRIAIFNGFFALFAVTLGLGWAVRRARPGWPRALVHVGLGGVVVLGVLDQTSRRMIPEYETIARAFRADAEYVGRIEAMLPTRAMVFQLPLARYPEEAAPGRIKSYDLARPYLHSKTLRWSYGAMKGRYGSEWQEVVAAEPPAEMARLLGFAGFGGILVDRSGYLDAGAAIESDLARDLQVTPVASNDGRYAFFSMIPYTAELTRGLGPEELAGRRRAALRPVTASWRRGFYAREAGADATSWHWCDGYGEIVLKNPSPEPRRVEVRMTLATLGGQPIRVCVERPDGAKAYPADHLGVDVAETIAVPPGGTTLKLGSDGVTAKSPGDPRNLAFRVVGFRLSEARDAPAVGTALAPSATRR